MPSRSYKPFFRSHNSILLRSHNNTSFKRNNFTYFRSSNSTSSELFLNLINWSHSECDYATAKIEPRLKALPSATKQTRQHLLLPRFVGEIRSILPALVPTLHNSFSGTGTGGGSGTRKPSPTTSSRQIWRLENSSYGSGGKVWKSKGTCLTEHRLGSP